jgi:hypothetical protein
MGLGLNACAEGFRMKTSYETFTMANAQAELWADYQLADNMCSGEALWQKKDYMKVEQDKATWTMKFNFGDPS